MTSTTTTNFDPALKQLYRAKRVEDLTFSRRPMLAMMPKFEGFGGRNMPVVLKYGNPQGVSAVFATAQANRSQVRVEDFLLTRVNMHSVASVDGEVAEASVGDTMSFLSAMAAAIDGAMSALSDVIESYMPRTGTGSIGAVSAESTVTLTLTLVEDGVNFEVGMELVVSDSTDGNTLRTGTATVTGIDRSAGTLTSDSNWTTQITALVATDLLYREGDAANGGANVVTSGFESWLPASAPGTTAFFGVDRSIDTTRMGGNRYDGTSDLTEEALIAGQSVATREGAAIDTYFVNHTKYRQLTLELGSKARYGRKMAKNGDGEVARIGFQSVVVDGDRGPIDVVSANKCQRNTAWGLELDTWYMNSLGKCVKISMLDNNRILRQSSADGYEVRIVHRGNLSCSGPGRNVRVALSTS